MGVGSTRSREPRGRMAALEDGRRVDATTLRSPSLRCRPRTIQHACPPSRRLRRGPRPRTIDQRRQRIRRLMNPPTAHSEDRLARDLELAVDRGEILAHYQPQIDTISGRVVAVEALCRWWH